MARTGLNRAAAIFAAANLAHVDTTTGGPRCTVSAFRPIEAHATTSIPLHKIWLGPSGFSIEHSGSTHKTEVVALPAGTVHRISSTRRELSSLVYLDARRFRFADVERLARRLGSFVPGHDDPLEVYADALKLPAPRLDARLEKAMELLESGASVAEIARRVGLSESRLSHLFSERLGAPLRAWRSWFLLRSATLHIASGRNFTQAAHASGFADAAHLSRTHRNILGVTPTDLAHYRTRFVTDRKEVLDCDTLRATQRSPGAVAATILGAYGR
jgi:AraC-like DNA-binding protein